MTNTFFMSKIIIITKQTKYKQVNESRRGVSRPWRRGCVETAARCRSREVSDRV